MEMIKRNALSFKKESDSIISVFTSTIEKLKNLNDKMLKLKNENSAKILELQDENNDLDATVFHNASVVSKLEKLTDNE